MKCSIVFIALCYYKSFGCCIIDCCSCSKGSSNSLNNDLEAENNVTVDLSFDGHSKRYTREKKGNCDLIVHIFKVRSDDHALAEVVDGINTVCKGEFRTVEYVDDDYALLKVEKKKKCSFTCPSPLYYQKDGRQWSAIKRKEYNRLLNEIKTKRKIDIDIKNLQENDDYLVEESVDEEREIAYTEYTPKRGTIVTSVNDGMDVICKLDPSDKRCKKITLVHNNKTGVTYLNVSIPGRFNDLFFTKVKYWGPCTDDDYYNGIGLYSDGLTFNIADKNGGLFVIKPLSSFITTRLQFEPKPDTIVNKVHHNNKVLWRKISDEDELIVAYVVYQKNTNNPLMVELFIFEDYEHKSLYFSKGSDGWVELDKYTFGFLWYATEMSNKINPKILLLPEIDGNKRHRTIIPSRSVDRTPDQDTLDRKPIRDENVADVRDENVPNVRDEKVADVRDEKVPTVRDENAPTVRDENAPTVRDENAPTVVVEGEQAKLKGRNATSELADVPSDDFPVPYPQPSYEPEAELEMIDSDVDDFKNV